MEKNNKTLNVPHLRFPEFSKEWEICKVSDILDFYSTNSLAWEQLEYGAYGLKNLHYGLIHNGLSTCVDTKDAILPVIKQNCIPKNYTECQNGDVAFADASEDTNDVAKCVEFTDCHADKVVCGLHTIQGRDKGDKTVVGFKGYAFSSQAFRHQIRRLAQGTKIYSISSKNFSECNIGIPSKEEQTKIATLLKLIEQCILTQKKIIEKYESLIKGITDKVFYTPHVYFLCSFGTLYKDAGEGGTPSTSNPQYYEDGTIPFIKIDDLSQKYLVAHKDCITELGLRNSSAWLIPTGSVLYSNGATIGAISINTYPVSTKQGILGIVPNDCVCAEYLYYLMTSKYFRKQVHRIITEGTMRTAYLKDINRILCPVPDKNEQQSLAKSISLVTRKIEIEKATLKAFILQKRYLLSHLFI